MLVLITNIRFVFFTATASPNLNKYYKFMLLRRERLLA